MILDPIGNANKIVDIHDKSKIILDITTTEDVEIIDVSEIRNKLKKEKLYYLYIDNKSAVTLYFRGDTKIEYGNINNNGFLVLANTHTNALLYRNEYGSIDGFSIYNSYFSGSRGIDSTHSDTHLYFTVASGKYIKSGTKIRITEACL